MNEKLRSFAKQMTNYVVLKNSKVLEGLGTNEQFQIDGTNKCVIEGLLFITYSLTNNYEVKMH
jgi:hypothetical protein